MSRGESAGGHGPVEVGGDVRRIAIVTIRENPCASYLARRIRSCGAEIAYFNQTELKVDLRSRAYFLRLWRRRGAWNALDNLLRYGAVAARGALRRGRVAAAPPPTPYPAMIPDPALRNEPWLRFVDIRDVNSEEGRDAIRAFAPDLILLGGAPILSRKTIAIPRIACINPHCGITPDFAGGSPFDWALYEGRFDDIGFTIHLVAPVVDSGPVIVQERVRWDPEMSITGFWPMLAQAMYERLGEVACRLAAGERLTATPQGPARVLPPAGLVVALIADLKRRRYARRRAAADAPKS